MHQQPANSQAARRRVQREDASRETNRLRQAKLLDAFLAAARNGEFTAVSPSSTPMSYFAPRVVYSFTIRDERIIGIDLIADPARLRQPDLTIPND